MHILSLLVYYTSAVAAQCAMYGECGAMSRFGSPLPCVNSTTPQKLESGSARQLLADYCGEEFANGDVCCSDKQVDQLVGNLKRVAPLISSCPACERNFFDVFCRFSCSPEQAKFLEVVETQQSLTDKPVPKEVNYYLDKTLAEQIYDSCSSVKFSATNGRVMDLIGGGAQNYTEFFKFLGDEKPALGGSPFQITYPWDSIPSNFVRQNETEAFPCGSGDLKCSCIDCDAACPEIVDEPPPGQCTVGRFSCVNLALLLSYLAFMAAGFLFFLQSRKSERTQSAMEIQRLIEDEDQNQDIYLFNLRQENEIVEIEPYSLNQWLSKLLQRLAQFCTAYPYLVIVVCVLFILCSSLGLLTMRLETDPTHLWVASDSREAIEKNFFDDQFGGFYRTNQLFLVNESGPILQTYDNIDWLDSIEKRVSKLKTPILFDKLNTFCLKPVNDVCVVESITQYGVQNTPVWKSRMERCIKEPVTCLPKFQQPLDPHVIFGRTNHTSFGNKTKPASAYLNTSTLVTTWVLQNSDDQVYKQRVSDWEFLVEDFFKTTVSEEAADRGLRLSFNVESSLERELAKSGRSDVIIVVISYLLMFAYVSYSLGDSIWLGFVGVCVVLFSIISAAGILSILDYKLSLIVTEVIPFLALAIGVDNVFLLVNQVQISEQINPAVLPSIEERISNAVGSVGPSIVLSTLCEISALSVAALVKMPAVRNFAIYGSVTILINSILQLTLFVSIFTLYMRKQAFQGLPDNDDDSFESPNIRNPQTFQQDQRGLAFFISAIYAPLILGRRTKQVMGCVFMTLLALSLYVLPNISLGLDQRLAVPKDSFLVDYYTDVYEYLDIGPPVYFVVPNAEVEDRSVQQKLCSRFSTCETNSLVNILNAERKRPHVSYLASSPASWIDDFFMWLNPTFDKCCIDKQGEVCYREEGKIWDFNMTGFPEDRQFSKYISKWLDQPSDVCPLAGKAPYTDALSLDKKTRKVIASSFRVNHSPLRSQQDYINAYEAAREIAEFVQSEMEIDVFPYSVFYAFFAQYTTIIKDTLKLVTLALLSTFFISLILLGSFRTASVVTVVVTSLIISMGGAMYVLNINLNALSLVNLVICVGLGVEFCIHIARSFTFVPRLRVIGIRGYTKLDRAYNALAGTGGTVFSGVAVTKLLGVSVLFFAQSQIFKVYYFKMWFALVVLATLHSLVLLPILLSIAGGRMWLIEGEDNEFTGVEDI